MAVISFHLVKLYGLPLLRFAPFIPSLMLSPSLPPVPHLHLLDVYRGARGLCEQPVRWAPQIGASGGEENPSPGGPQRGVPDSIRRRENRRDQCRNWASAGRDGQHHKPAVPAGTGRGWRSCSGSRGPRSRARTSTQSAGEKNLSSLSSVFCFLNCECTISIVYLTRCTVKCG